MQPANAPYLRVQRKFPQDPQALSVEMDNSYLDIANAVNSRAIAIFSQGRTYPTGGLWYISGNKYQEFRQIYSISATGNTPHFLNTNNIFQFSKISGTFTDGTNFYPLPYVNATSATNQIQVSVTPTNIVLTPGGGSPPAFSSGVVVLEWLILV